MSKFTEVCVTLDEVFNSPHEYTIGMFAELVAEELIAVAPEDEPWEQFVNVLSFQPIRTEGHMIVVSVEYELEK